MEQHQARVGGLGRWLRVDGGTRPSGAAWRRMDLRASLCIVSALAALAGSSGWAFASAADSPPAQEVTEFAKLIATVDQPGAADTIIGRYLSPEPLPGVSPKEVYDTAALAMLDHPFNTVRWYSLERIAAYASFRVNSFGANQGYIRYDDLFQAWPGAKALRISALMETSIAEFCETVGGRYGQYAMVSYDRPDGVVSDAARAYFGLLRAGYVPTRTIQWVPAVGRCWRADSVLGVARAAAGEPQARTNLAWVAATAGILQQQDQAGAQRVLTRAGPLLAHSTGPWAEECRAIQVNLFVRAGKLSDAVAAQRGVAEHTGQGSAYLLQLADEAGDEAAVDVACRLLAQEKADETDIIRAAEYLNVMAAQKPAAPRYSERCRAILTAQLSSKRRWSAEGEVEARLILASLLVKAGSADQAWTVLSAPAAEAALRASTDTYHRSQFEELRAELAASRVK